MWRRIIIVAFAITVVSVLAYVLSQPKEGSLEWHKREYLGLRTRMASYSVLEQVENAFSTVTGIGFREWDQAQFDAMEKKRRLHERALLEMRFLVKHEVPAEVTDRITLDRLFWSKDAIDGYAYAELKLRGSNMFIEVSTPRSDLPKWKALIRKHAGESDLWW